MTVNLFASIIRKYILPSLQRKDKGEGLSIMEKYLIVGLGNPGDEYARTRHNIGWRVVSALAEEKEAQWEDRRYGFVARISVKGRQLILLRPTTYMNLSGNAVRYWMQQEKIELDHLLIVVDDLALPFGQLRMKPSGSDAGHNGLKHIAETLGTQAYARLRFGIGNEFSRGHQIDFVLGEFPEEEAALLPECLKQAGAAIKTYCLAGIQMAMNQCNRANKPKPEQQA